MTWEEWERRKAERRTDELVDRSLGEMRSGARQRRLEEKRATHPTWEAHKALLAFWEALEDSCFLDAGCMSAWGAHMAYSVALDRGDPGAIA